MSKSTLKKDYFWNTIGVFLQSAISPILLIVITRINGIDAAGIFSFAFSVAIVLWAFGMWGGRTYQVSDVKAEFSQSSYVAVRILLSICMIILAVFFSLLNNYDTTKLCIILTLVGMKAVESIADSIHGVLQAHGRLYVAGISLVYKSLIGLAVFITINYITKNILLASIGLLVVTVIVTVFYDLKIALKQEHLVISRHHVIEAIKIMRTCFSVFAITFLAAFPLNIPRYFVDMYHGEEIGFFGILAMPITLVVLLMSFIMQPNIVELSRLFSKHEYRKFRHIIRRIFEVTCGMAILFLTITFFAGVPILTIVFGEDFAGYKTALLIMIAGGLANALVAIFMNVLTIMRHFKAQLFVLLASNILQFIIAALTVRQYGLIGGVYLFMISSFVQALLLIFLYKKYLNKAQRHEKN